MAFKNILYSGFDFTEEDRELKFKYLFFNSLLFFNISVIGIIAIIRYINEQYFQTIFDLSYVLLGIIVIFVSRLSKTYFKKIVYFVIFYSFIVVAFLIYKESNSFISVGWLFVLLLTTSFLLDRKEKIIVFIFFILFVIFIEFIKKKHAGTEVLLSIAPFLVTMLFLYFFDKKNENIQTKLELANKLLQDHNIKLDEDVKTSKFEIFKFKQIFEKSPVSIVITDNNGDIEYVNPWFSKISGYSLEDVLGKTPRVLKSEFLSESTYQKLWNDISNGIVWNGTFKNIAKEGEEYWESAIIAPIYDKNKKLTNYIGIKQEITQRVYLQEQLEQKQEQIKENFEKTLESLVNMVEKRDTYTGGHSKRVAEYSLLIGKEMKLSKDECDLLYKASILHDIGKISTPDSILLKPSALINSEYEIIQEHVTSSYEILSNIPMYKSLADIVICHHERYDGKGYPKGLKEDEIPFLSQIMIVADAFDAMVTNRIYKGRKSVFEALQELSDYSGTQFHPNIVKNALKALKKLDLSHEIFQHPNDNVEKERFSYFFKDQLTGLNSMFYLNFLLSNNSLKCNYSFMSIIYLHNFSQYNQKHGWVKGDELLMKFSRYLMDNFKNATIFRVFGDDFILLSRDYIDISVKSLEKLEIFDLENINISKEEIDFMFENSKFIEDKLKGLKE